MGSKLSRSLFAFMLYALVGPGIFAAAAGPEVAPGLRIPANAVLPFALDSVGGQPELVPLRRSSLQWNQRVEANRAGRLGRLLQKPKEVAELAGAAAAVTLHTRRPKFYYHLSDNPEPEQVQDSNVTGWMIVTATVDKDTRVLAQIRFTEITGYAKHSDSRVETTDQTLTDGWHVLEPKVDLPDGQYAMAPILQGDDTYAASAFDFGVSPSAPENAGVVKAGGGE